MWLLNFTLLPIFTLFFLLAIHVGELTLFKMKLQQVAVDAAYLGASSITETLNRLALQNRKVFEIYLQSKKAFAVESRADKRQAAIGLKESWRKQEEGDLLWMAQFICMLCVHYRPYFRWAAF